jgi:phosphoglycolate phosphatase
MAIVSSGSGPRVRRQIEAFGLASYFHSCVCCEDAPERKPHPAPLLTALKNLNLSPGECVYVGDAPEDVQMARAAGVAVVGVRGPFPTAERVIAAKPDVFLESVAELPKYLKNGNRGGKGSRERRGRRG